MLELALKLVLAPVWAAQVAPGALSTVARFETVLIELMGEHAEHDHAAREMRLARLLDETFDLGHTARLALGRHWNSLGPEHRMQFRTLFATLVSASFAAQIGPHSGQRFKFELARPLKRGRVLIRTSLVQDDADAERFDYVLHAVERTGSAAISTRSRAGRSRTGRSRTGRSRTGRSRTGVGADAPRDPVSSVRAESTPQREWRIVNIIVDGVSDLALKRSEYGKVLAEDGFDALVARIRSQINALRVPK